MLMIGSLYIRMEWNGIFLNCKFKQAEMVRYCERNMGSLQIFLIKLKTEGRWPLKYKKITERPPFCKQFFLMIFIRRNTLRLLDNIVILTETAICIIIIIIIIIIILWRREIFAMRHSNVVFWDFAYLLPQNFKKNCRALKTQQNKEIFCEV